MRPFSAIAVILALALAGAASAAEDNDDARLAACKQAMNARIQVCTDDCTKRALAAASDYKDTNNNVKFGCMKGCALRQVFQMRVCRQGGTAAGADPTVSDPTETNRH